MLGITTEGLLRALPLIIAFCGLGLLILAYTVPFPQPAIGTFLGSIGHTLLGSGVFALILKSYQYLGVFREELSKIVYDAKHLSDRRDLPEIWKNVSKVLFKNRFPAINSEITEDVLNIYLPTQYVSYYDDWRQHIFIELIDQENQVVEVRMTDFYTIYPLPGKGKTTLESKNWLCFNCDKTEVEYKVVKFEVNGKDVRSSKEYRFYSDVDKANNKLLFSSVRVDLKNQDKFTVELEVIKRYSLKHDRVIQFAKDGIIHDFNVKVETKGVKTTFLPSGTLKNFADQHYANGNFHEYQYRGIIYPKQGYVICMEVS